MKKKLCMALALLLSLLMLFSGCSAHGRTLIEAGDNKLSVNLFEFYLSRAIGALAVDGYSVGLDSFWDEYENMNNQTRAQLYTELVLEGMKQRAAALMIYDEMGLSLSREERDAIDAYIDELIAQDANGSETAFESMLSPYGANLTVFRDALIVEAKIAQLKTELYGADGSAIGYNAQKEFYNANYLRGMRIWLSSTYYDHEKDGDGHSVCYLLDEEGNLNGISYDTVNGVAVQEGDKTVYRTFGSVAYDTENGVASKDRDEEGYLIYYKAEGSKEIAYDTVNGKPEVKIENGALTETAVTDANGQQVYRKWVIAYETNPEGDQKVGLNYTLNAKNELVEMDYSPEEIDRKAWLATKILSECLAIEDYEAREAAFVAFAEAYSDAAVDNGMYFVRDASYSDAELLQQFADKLEELEVGEMHVIGVESGYHILLRCELDDDAWKNEDNSMYFTSMTALLIEHMLQNRILSGGYMDRLVIDSELLATVNIKEISPNYYY